MRYEDNVIFRPPSEAKSFILQVTRGCSHNKCTFCNMYKNKDFRLRNMEDVIADIKTARARYRHIERIFICDGNPLVLSNEKLKTILTEIKNSFPECKRISAYTSAKDILRRTDEELLELRELGLSLLYLGIESGNDRVLESICKGVTSEEINKAGRMIKDAGIKLSVTIISGMGAKKLSDVHALDTARLLSDIDPDYIGLLALRIKEGTELYSEYSQGNFEKLTAEEILDETIKIVSELNVSNCIFRNNHAGNYFGLAGTLPHDKTDMLNKLCRFKEKGFDFDEDYEEYRTNL